jgi:hypothetical protein
VRSRLRLWPRRWPSCSPVGHMCSGRLLRWVCALQEGQWDTFLECRAHRRLGMCVQAETCALTCTKHSTDAGHVSFGRALCTYHIVWHRPAQVLIKRRKKGRSGDTWEVVRARGHLDEVQELRKGGTKLIGVCELRGGNSSFSGLAGCMQRSARSSRHATHGLGVGSLTRASKRGR